VGHEPADQKVALAGDYLIIARSEEKRTAAGRNSPEANSSGLIHAREIFFSAAGNCELTDSREMVYVDYSPLAFMHFMHPKHASGMSMHVYGPSDRAFSHHRQIAKPTSGQSQPSQSLP
jgi:hypothetical protein